MKPQSTVNSTMVAFLLYLENENVVWCCAGFFGLVWVAVMKRLWRLSHCQFHLFCGRVQTLHCRKQLLKLMMSWLLLSPPPLQKKKQKKKRVRCWYWKCAGSAVDVDDIVQREKWCGCWCWCCCPDKKNNNKKRVGFWFWSTKSALLV